MSVAPPQAWLEFSSGERIFIQDLCTIGRTAGNTILIPSERVSRRHAVIRRGPDGTFEVMDMGSSNGTYVNGQRIARPARLQDGQVIEVGMQKFTFRLPPVASGGVTDSESVTENCWLLIVEAALLGTRNPAEDRGDKTIESWNERCQRIVRKYRGAIVRAANEGILAFWRTSGGEGSPSTVATVLRSLRATQMQTEEFRFAIHFAEVTLQRGASGEWKPTGSEVIFALQLQRLVTVLVPALIVTEAAREQLQTVLPIRPLTVAELRTYRGSNRFHTLNETAATP